MKLIEYSNYQIKVADEAFLVKPIRTLFNKDKSKTKDNFWSQMSYMYFLVDPRSSYMYIVDEFSYTQIAKIENRSIPTVKESIDRGLENLRKKLKKFYK